MKIKGFLVLVILGIFAFSSVGVYATWSYSQGAVASATDEYAVVMTAETVDGAKCSFNVVSNSVTFEVGNKGDYHPELRSTGHVDVTFTPKAGTGPTPKINTISSTRFVTIATIPATIGTNVCPVSRIELM